MAAIFITQYNLFRQKFNENIFGIQRNNITSNNYPKELWKKGLIQENNRFSLLFKKKYAFVPDVESIKIVNSTHCVYIKKDHSFNQFLNELIFYFVSW